MTKTALPAALLALMAGAALADLGWQAAFRRDPGLAAGLNVHAGEITHEAVGKALGLPVRPLR